MPTHCVGAAGRSGALKGRTCQHAVATQAVQQCINLLQQLPPGGELEDISVTWCCFGVPILTMAVLTVAVPCRASPPKGQRHRCCSVRAGSAAADRRTRRALAEAPTSAPSQAEGCGGYADRDRRYTPPRRETCANTTESSGVKNVRRASTIGARIARPASRVCQRTVPRCAWLSVKLISASAIRQVSGAFSCAHVVKTCLLDQCGCERIERGSPT